MRLVLLGMLIATGLCALGGAYGQPVLDHLMFAAGYMKIAGARVDGTAPPCGTQQGVVEGQTQ